MWLIDKIYDFNLFQMVILKMFLQSCFLLPTYNNITSEKTFLQNFLVILKHLEEMFPRYYTWTVILSAI